MLAADIDPFAAGLYLVAPERRAILPRGDDPRFADAAPGALPARRRRRRRPDRRHRAAAARRASASDYAAAGVELVVASERDARTRAWTSGRWPSAAAGTVRVPATRRRRRGVRPGAVALPVIVKPRSGSGSRGIRLVERRAELEALERDGTLLVQEHLPGAGVLARRHRARRRARRRRRPARALKVDSGIAVTGRTLHDERLEAFARAVARLIGLTTVANVQVKLDAAGVPALLEVNPRFPGTMPLTVAAGIDMPRLAIGEALGTPIPDGPLPFEDIAMVRYFQERFFAFDEIAELQGDAAGSRPVNPRQDMHVHSTFSDGRDPIEGNVAEAEALGLTQLTCVDHVRAGTDWVPEYVAAVRRIARRHRRRARAARSRPSCSTRPARSTCPADYRRRRRDLRGRPPGAARRRAEPPARRARPARARRADRRAGDRGDRRARPPARSTGPSPS